MSSTKGNSITITFKRSKIGYMMATKAFHLLGDLSMEEPDLCSIYGDTDPDKPEHGYYVGMWELGYGFFNVLFPKKTTRPLTDAEVDEWSKRRTAIGHQPSWGYNADDLRSSRGIIESIRARSAYGIDANPTNTLLHIEDASAYLETEKELERLEADKEPFLFEISRIQDRINTLEEEIERYDAAQRAADE